MVKIRKRLISVLIMTLIVSLTTVSVSALSVVTDGFSIEINQYTKKGTVVDYRGTSESVRIPEKYSTIPVETVADSLFLNKSFIKNIVVPNGITNLGNEAFKGTSISEIFIPNSVISIGAGLLENCNSLTFVNYNTSIKDIPASMFADCSQLENIIFLSSVQSVGEKAFYNCTSLKDFEFLKDTTQIDSYAFYHTGAEQIVLSDSLESIPDYSFAQCQNLQRVSIPSSVNYISPTAFDGDANLTIVCEYNSYAHNYAVEKNIPYIASANFLLGDVDGVDGVNIIDVTAIQSHLAELKTVEGIYLFAADANRDDIVDISDATAIQMKLAEYELPYPIGQYITKEIVSE